MDLPVSGLRVMHAIALQGSVTGAAAALHYTPSAVSQQVASLERIVGVPLTERIGRTIRLTPAGRVLAEESAQVLAALAHARTAVEANVGEVGGTVTLGIFSSAVASVLTEALEILAKRAPLVELDVHELEPEDALDEMRGAALDAALVLDYPDAPLPLAHPSLRYRPLLPESFFLAVPRDRNLTAPVPLAVLREETWIASGPETHYGRAFRARCQRAGFTPRVRHRVDEPATALALVAAGLGVAQITLSGQSPCRADVALTAIADPMRREILMVTRRSIEQRPSIVATVGAFEEVAARLQQR